MRDIGFQLNKSFALGVNTEVTLQQSGDEWITTQPAPVSIDTIDAGIALKNLHFSVAMQPGGELALKNFAAELLEGALTSDELRWHLGGEERRSELQFTGVSIRALAREIESENFAASGLLDATIPLVTDQQGITIENGTVQSRPPGGRLRYYGAFSPAMLGSNPQLKLLAGALEDYNYRDIHGTINYPLSGDLLLNLKLTGRSDAIDANRDLIINLNLENNIPTMLRSLQASRDLTDVLEKEVR
nr:YdbH domain-containing protein [Microbulbifer salipaludis]